MTSQYDKYALYSEAVQDASFDFEFLNDEYQRLYGRPALSLREDFCGSGYLSNEWVQLSDQHSAVGIDLSAETLAYAEEQRRLSLSPDQQECLQYLQRDVLECSDMHADIIIAFNFSYWVFRERQELLAYFQSVRQSMNDDSVFILDTKGGTEVVMVGTETKSFDGFTYYWECESYNPITRECHYAIHFKKPGLPKMKRAFTYHWRFWCLPEIRDLLSEAGFSRSIVYMEGEDENGEGDGDFAPTEVDEDSCIWVAYIAAIP